WIADVYAVQKRGVLPAGRAARAERALQAAGRAAHVGTTHDEPRHLRLEEAPDVAAAGRALNQLLAQVHVDVRTGRVNGRRRARHGNALSERRDLHQKIHRRRLTDEDDDILAVDRLETGELRPDRVGAGNQRRKT